VPVERDRRRIGSADGGEDRDLASSARPGPTGWISVGHGASLQMTPDGDVTASS
jgi:hypothetical protein